jgi:hypothetical protein
MNANQTRVFGHTELFHQHSSHSIKIKCGMDILLKMKGVISYIPMQKPTDQDIAHIRQIQMASALPWDPHSNDFADAKQLALQQTSAVQQSYSRT